MEVSAALRPLQERLQTLDSRLGEWQAQVKVELEGEFAKLSKTGKLQDPGAQQEAARLALARAGDGPRRELNGAIDELCNLYLKGEPGLRAEIRELVQQNHHVFHDLWGYVRRAAEQVRAGGGELWCRFGLAVVSIEDSLGDMTDTLEGLSELHQAAVRDGIDPAPLFKGVAALSNNKINEGREFSTRKLLEEFDPARVHAHR